MAKRAARAKNFGLFLQGKRGERSRQWVTQQLERFGVELDQSAVARYEEGRIPPITVMVGFSHVYGIPFSSLVSQIVTELKIAPVKWPDSWEAQQDERLLQETTGDVAAASRLVAVESGLRTIIKGARPARRREFLRRTSSHSSPR